MPLGPRIWGSGRRRQRVLGEGVTHPHPRLGSWAQTVFMLQLLRVQELFLFEEATLSRGRKAKGSCPLISRVSPYRWVTGSYSKDVCFCLHTLARYYPPNTHTFVFSAFSPSAQCSDPRPAWTDPPLPRLPHPSPHPAAVVRSHRGLPLPAALLCPSPLPSTLPDPRSLPLIPLVPAP